MFALLLSSTFYYLPLESSVVFNDTDITNLKSSGGSMAVLSCEEKIRAVAKYTQAPDSSPDAFWVHWILTRAARMIPSVLSFIQCPWTQDGLKRRLGTSQPKYYLLKHRVKKVYNLTPSNLGIPLIFFLCNYFQIGQHVVHSITYLFRKSTRVWYISRFFYDRKYFNKSCQDSYELLVLLIFGRWKYEQWIQKEQARFRITSHKVQITEK